MYLGFPCSPLIELEIERTVVVLSRGDMLTEIYNLDNMGMETEIVAVSRIQADIFWFSTCGTGNGKDSGGMVMWIYVH
jgi:hypothetical protein